MSETHEPEKTICPHCNKEIEPEPMSDESIEQIVKLVSAAEESLAGSGLKVSQSVRMMLRMMKKMNEDKSIGDLERMITGKEKIQ